VFRSDVIISQGVAKRLRCIGVFSRHFFANSIHVGRSCDKYLASFLLDHSLELRDRDGGAETVVPRYHVPLETLHFDHLNLEFLLCNAKVPLVRHGL